MSHLVAAPEMMTSAATDLATIGSNVSAAHMVAAAPTVGVVPAAADEVSAGIAHVFSQHAAGYQALAGQAAAFQEQFVQHLSAGAFSYAEVEAALASLLQGANGFVSYLAALPPQQLLYDALIVLALPLLLVTSPIWFPVLFYFYSSLLSHDPLYIG